MTFRSLSSVLAKREALKKQVSIGNVREVLSHIVKLNRETNGEVVALIATQSAKRKR